MSAKLEPGGLALVISDRDHPENVGACVELFGFYRAGEPILLPGLGTDTTVAQDGWVVIGPVMGGTTWGEQVKGSAAYEPHELMPLSGDELPQVRRTAELTA